MKNIIIIFLIIISFLGLYNNNIVNVINKKPYKIVCVNSFEVLENMQEYISYKKKLEVLINNYENYLKKINDEIKMSFNKNEILLLLKKKDSFQKMMTNDLLNKEKELISPIIQKFLITLKKVMNEDPTIMRIDDSSPGKGVLINIGPDITNKVKKELNCIK
ncbi:MAG: OmpH family outer membrane protein [Candidatus Bostrichicola ureolyticus]|nr:MAG: OmpH family outer membrane protein [Candidatus Bostrichicola ureolyticus]